MRRNCLRLLLLGHAIVNIGINYTNVLHPAKYSVTTNAIVSMASVAIHAFHLRLLTRCFDQIRRFFGNHDGRRVGVGIDNR